MSDLLNAFHGVLNSTIFQTARGLVSKDKFRFISNGYNLDLTYITERVIAMGYPGDGIHSTYRNSADDVSRFFREFHPGHYKIFNVSEVPYAAGASSKLGGPDVCLFLGWPDHHSPSLRRLLEVVLLMDQWLIEDPSNVAAVHCQAGRGRTGLVIAAYLLYIGLFHHADDALAYFASTRSATSEGVSSPAQRRYVQYFSSILPQLRACVCSPSMPSSEARPSRSRHDRDPLKYIDFPPGRVYPTKEFRKIVIKNLPSISPFIPFVQLCDVKQWPYVTIFNASANAHFTPVDQQVTIEINRYVEGDFLLRLFNQNSTFGFLNEGLLCRMAFNTLFMSPHRMEDNHYVFEITKYDIDSAKSGPLRDPRFAENFKIEIHYLNAEAAHPEHRPMSPQSSVMRDEGEQVTRGSLYPRLDNPYTSPPSPVKAPPLPPKTRADSKNTRESFVGRTVVVDLSKTAAPFDEEAFKRFFSVCGDISHHLISWPLCVILFREQKSADTALYLNGGLLMNGPVEIMTMQTSMQKRPNDAETISDLASRILLSQKNER
ncbi:hypothetical protein PROFUN_08507 [Planoprotostelium fungivorum]|uniref:Uncharacterized protein n=1 Tax=Planoprotostelium fungivorum TaxID=1890364 RepID=A0A2P6NJA8_9EUKA|nr:hypothetical protein PROFUN_08507 [Planoprotostelium fungivorum]